MDFRAKESSWQAKANNIFKKSAVPGSTNTSSTNQEVIRKYKNLVHKKPKIWWTKITLENYIAQKIIPRGLRINLFPTFDLDDDNLVQKWIKAANTCSFEFINIIIEKNATTLKTIETEIETLQKSLQQELTVEALQSMISNLDKDIEKWEENISLNKQRKYNRDMTDFENNKIFRWQIKTIHTSRKTSRSSSVTSLSSMSEGGESNYHGPRTRQLFHKKSTLSDTDPRGDGVKVINLSSHILTDSQLKVLQKGLTFSPTSPLSPFTAIKDLHLLSRKIVLKKLHHKEDMGKNTIDKDEQEALEALESLLEENESEVSRFPMHIISKSHKFPPLATVPVVETFTKMVAADIERIQQTKKKSRYNLTVRERKALDELTKWNDVVFKMADKGGNIVIWPNSQYETQANKLLSNPKEYKKLTYNPTSEFKSELVNILTLAFENGIIPKKLVDIHQKLEPRIATLYLVPKIHKNQLDPPGRPIIAANEGLCEIACNIIEHFLQPLVKQLPSFVKDTTAVLGHLENIHLTENMVLVTADVEALYSSIRHTDGLKATNRYLTHSNIDKDMANLILALLEFVLTHNVFTFNGKVYRQLQGTAMGATCAPSYANLFMGAWEWSIFQGEEIPGVERIHHWVRYIDDIMFIWEGPTGDLETMMRKLNNNDQNIKLTYKFGHQIEFLDLYISAQSNGQISTTVFRKPTATNALLHASSSHLKSTINGIPIGQFLRVKRICSEQSDFEIQSQDLKRRFKDRGYNKKIIEKGYRRARDIERSKLLHKNQPALDNDKYDNQLFHLYGLS